MLCPYKTLLGIREQGVHSARVLGLARNDILMTVIGALVTSFFFKVSILWSLIGWFVAGEVLHILFGVDTAFLELLGIPPCNTVVISLTAVATVVGLGYLGLSYLGLNLTTVAKV
jgi:hypothetical protein